MRRFVVADRGRDVYAMTMEIDACKYEREDTTDAATEKSQWVHCTLRG